MSYLATAQHCSRQTRLVRAPCRPFCMTSTPAIAEPSRRCSLPGDRRGCAGLTAARNCWPRGRGCCRSPRRSPESAVGQGRAGLYLCRVSACRRRIPGRLRKARASGAGRLAISAEMCPIAAAAGWELPPLRSMGELADWLGISTGELEWFADCKQSRIQTQPRPAATLSLSRC